MATSTDRGRNAAKHVLRLALVFAFTAMAALGFAAGALEGAALAKAEKRYWDLDLFKQCLDAYGPASQYTILEWVEVQHTCCDASDGVWDEWTGNCSAPPGDQPGSRRVPTDIGTVTLTPTPPRPSPRSRLDTSAPA